MAIRGFEVRVGSTVEGAGQVVLTPPTRDVNRQAAGDVRRWCEGVSDSGGCSVGL